VALYEFSNARGGVLDNDEVGFGKDTNTPGVELDAYAASAELGCKTGIDALPFVTLFGEYVGNQDESDSGYLYGIKFGHKKVKKAKQWQAKALYRRLEKDAWFDKFPDSDAYSGRTGVKGPEFVFKYGLTRNISLALDYYMMEYISGNSDEEDLIQIDLNFKF